jgi:hypothetical protein
VVDDIVEGFEGSGARGGSGTSETLLGTTRALAPAGLIKEENGVCSGLTIHATDLGRLLPRARPQSLTAAAPPQHLSLAGQAGEPRRRYSPSAPAPSVRSSSFEPLLVKG